MKLGESLKIMGLKDAHREPIPFKIKFCTADRSRGTGGELIELPKAVLSQNLKDLPRYARGDVGSKKVNQYTNAIRNLYDLEHQRFYKVSIYLILEINGVQVL